MLFTGDFNEFRIFGVPWEPTEFLQKSMMVTHPMDRSGALPTELRFAILQMAQRDASEVAKHRLDFFKFWNERAEQLDSEEQQIRKSMDKTVEKAVRGKRLALFKDMLQFYKYPDLGVLDELVEGADLVGEVPRTGMVPLKFTPAVRITGNSVVHEEVTC